MSCFFLAQITIHDRDEYAKYEDGFDKIFEKYLGTVVAVDDDPMVLEGEWKHRRIVMIHFPSNEDAQRWYYSPEYQRLAQHRFRASDSTTMLVDTRE